MRLFNTLFSLVVGLSGANCSSSYQNAVQAMQPPSSVAPETWEENYATVREQWIEYLTVPANGRKVMDWRDGPAPIPPAYQHLLQCYLWAVQDQWIKRGEFRFVVLSEDGQPIDDATREVYDFVKLGGDLEPRFQVTTQKVVGEQRIKMTPKMLGLEVHLQSFGHRWIQFHLPMGPDYSAAHQMLQSGIVLPPLTPDGPVRVVMPFRYVWINGRKEDSTGHLSSPNRHPWPKVDLSLLDRQAINSSDNPGYVPVPKRGLYARIDRNGKVWNYEKLDAGALLGLRRAPGDYRNPNGWTIMRPGGGGTTAPESGAPYKWVLVFEPTRIPPEEARAENDRSRARVGLPPLYPATQRATTNATSK